MAMIHEEIKGYDNWKLRGPPDPKEPDCDRAHSECPDRFWCWWIEWPFQNWQEEEDAIANGTYNIILEDEGLE